MKRHESNPIITRKDIPAIGPQLEDVSSVFNPGAVKCKDRTVLLLRVQNRGRETFFLKAESADGARFKVDDKIVRFAGLEKETRRIYHCYDARITPIADAYHIVFAMDMDDACRLGLARTPDFESYEFLGFVSDEDSRNGVLFPEKIRGKYMLLERPNKFQLAGGPLSGNAIVLSESDDLRAWRRVSAVASGRFHYWDELIGAGPPPVKTRAGWLLVYHGVATHFAGVNIYQAGVMLLDLDNPSQIIGRCPYNILEPRETYELTGQVPNVVFPSGIVVDEFDAAGFARPHSRVRIYYGAADTVVGLAETTVKELLLQAQLGIPER